MALSEIIEKIKKAWRQEVPEILKYSKIKAFWKFLKINKVLTNLKANKAENLFKK